MKKVLLTLISIILVISSASVFANEEIEGLNENLDELLMKNYFTYEQFDEMNKEYMEYYEDYLLNEYIPQRQRVNKMETGSVEEEFRLLMNEAELVYEDGLRVSHFADYKYDYQYMKSKCFEYLFSDKEYWSVPLKKNAIATSSSKFKINGIRIKDYEAFKEFIGFENNRLMGQKRVLKLIEEKNTIKNLLIEHSVKKVEDIKFCSYVGNITGLYFKCDNNREFFLSVYSQYWDSFDKASDEYFEFTTLEELVTKAEEEWSKISLSYVTPVKPTYDEEALSLQNEGLLHGNEKGLDLLKPLTRVEAATMLLRAMGKETVANDGQAQTFIDVLSSHWGFGAVENAYSLGLIKGMGENIFAPDEPVTAVQFATMVLRAGNEAEFNWEEAIDILIEKGVITEENSNTMDFFTRGDMAKIIYEARENGLL